MLGLLGAGVAGATILEILGPVDVPAAFAQILWNHPFTTRHSGTAYFNDYNPAVWTHDGHHYALDLAASAGETVRACSAGTVVESYFNTTNALGNVVVIDHGSGYRTLYAHLQYPGILNTGATVAASTPIGYVGNTGGDYDFHLHVELQNPDRDHRISSDFLEGAPLALTTGSAIDPGTSLRSPVSYDLIPSGSTYWLVNTDFLNANGTPIKVQLQNADWGLMVAAKNNLRALSVEEANQYFALIGSLLPRAATQITP